MIEVILVVSATAYGAYRLGKRSRDKWGAKAPADNRRDSGTDNFEGWFCDGHEPRPLIANLDMRYVDANGNRTQRRIRVRQFDPGLSGGMMLAHCHLRDDTRSFRVDRVKSCVDTDTGEVIKNLHTFFEQRYSSSPDRVVELLAGDYRDIIRVLGYIALADGTFDAAEKTVISNYMRKLTRDDRINESLVERAAMTIGQTTLHGFKAAVGRVVNSGAVSPVLLAGCCREIAGADGEIAAREQEALDYLDRKIMNAPVAATIS